MYPIIIFSNDISEILERRPSEPLKPTDPKKEPLKVIYFIILFLGLSFLYLFFRLAVSSFKDRDIIYGIIVSCFMLVVLFYTFGAFVMIYDATVGNKSRVKKWKKQVEQWKVSHKQWEIDNANINNESYRQIREKEVLTFLNNREPAINASVEEECAVKKGITEEWFLLYIKKRIESIGGLLYLNKKIQILKSSIKGHLTKEMMMDDFINPTYYYPDIAIIINNLYIDIEIDEPYSMDERLPIHCLKSDDLRNSYISSQGWEIIRFAESQIVNYPERCLSTIVEVIEHIQQGKFGTPFIDYNERWITPQWDEKTAIDMLKVNHRESYLYDTKGVLKI